MLVVLVVPVLSSVILVFCCDNDWESSIPAWLLSLVFTHPGFLWSLKLFMLQCVWFFGFGAAERFSIFGVFRGDVGLSEIWDNLVWAPFYATHKSLSFPARRNIILNSFSLGCKFWLKFMGTLFLSLMAAWNQININKKETSCVFFIINTSIHILFWILWISLLMHLHYSVLSISMHRDKKLYFKPLS